MNPLNPKDLTNKEVGESIKQEDKGCKHDWRFYMNEKRETGNICFNCRKVLMDKFITKSYLLDKLEKIDIVELVKRNLTQPQISYEIILKVNEVIEDIKRLNILIKK